MSKTNIEKTMPCGVGAMVVQMAKASGARAVTTVGSPEKAKLATELGADHVINYKTDDVTAAVKVRVVAEA